jgi:hypothetical protein
MGGIGSGRYSGFGAATTDDFHAIDLAMMQRRGWTTAGTLTWSRGGCKTGSIGYAMYWHGLQLTYSAGGESIAELVPFAYTATAFGGQRKWFQCLSCRRRCRVLYGGKYFRCRRCYGAKYASQYARPWERMLAKAQAVRERLGGSPCLDEPFPEKPRGMHWRTYRKLQAQDERWIEDDFGFRLRW